MPTSKKKPVSRSKTSTKTSKSKLAITKKQSKILAWFLSLRFVVIIVTRCQDLLQRRPHRSFRRTYRRDYVRSLQLPGYWAFTNHVRKTLWDNKKIFLAVLAMYALITVSVVNLASETVYTELRTTVNEATSDIFKGFWGEIGKSGLLLLGGVSGSYNEAPTDSQSRTYMVFAGLLLWLTTVWLLRAIAAGARPKMRDGLYNAGAPIIPTIFIGFVAVLQLLPIALVFYGYTAAIGSGLLEGGVEAMLFWMAAAVLALLSAYWLTSTLIAMVVVTLPGMYPVQALRTAGDLVIGRRVRILLRMLWMLLIVVVTWVLVAIPTIMIDGWVKTIVPYFSSIPTVPIMLLVMGSLTLVWIAAYIYLLYRRIVADDALPA
ncbi:MAG TPA: hypothetical protein VF281_05135 [Candidatus Saccharimonadales bacterium]